MVALHNGARSLDHRDYRAQSGYATLAVKVNCLNLGVVPRGTNGYSGRRCHTLTLTIQDEKHTVQGLGDPTIEVVPLTVDGRSRGFHGRETSPPFGGRCGDRRPDPKLQSTLRSEQTSIPLWPNRTGYGRVSLPWYLVKCSRYFWSVIFFCSHTSSLIEGERRVETGRLDSLQSAMNSQNLRRYAI